MNLKLLALILMALCSPGLLAQVLGWQWAKNSNDDWGAASNCIVTDAAGNVFITGRFSGTYLAFGSTSMTKTTSGVGLNSDIFTAKFNAAGNLLWMTGHGGAYTDSGNGICADASGNTYAVGTFSNQAVSFGSFLLPNAGNSDLFIVKYDPSGSVAWAQSAGGANSDLVNRIAIDTGGNLLITGYFSSPTLAFGSTTLTNTGNFDMFIAKYDPAGNVLWAKNATGMGLETGFGISTDAAGNAFVAGTFNGVSLTFNTTTLTNADNTGSTDDVFLAKYDAAGNLLWANSYGGTANDGCSNLCTDAGGNACITGSFQSPAFALGSITLNCTNGSKLYTAKCNPAGTVLWAQSTGTTNGGSNSVSSDAAGNVLITGYFTSTIIAFSSTTLTNTDASGTTRDIFVAKYNTAGNLLWAKNEGGNLSETGVSITTDNAGTPHLTGNFDSHTLSFGTATLNNPSTASLTVSPDIFIAKMQSISTDVKKVSSQQVLAAFPNPFYSQVTLAAANYLNDATITLHNMLGQTVQELNHVFGKEIILLRDELPAGLYLLQLTEAGKITGSEKLMITD